MPELPVERSLFGDRRIRLVVGLCDQVLQVSLMLQDNQRDDVAARTKVERGIEVAAQVGDVRTLLTIHGHGIAMSLGNTVPHMPHSAMSARYIPTAPAQLD